MVTLQEVHTRHGSMMNIEKPDSGFREVHDSFMGNCENCGNPIEGRFMVQWLSTQGSPTVSITSILHRQYVDLRDCPNGPQYTITF